MLWFRITCTLLRKDMMWARSLSLNPMGMGLIWETTLQNEDKFCPRMWLGISGYTFDKVRRVVGLTRGVKSRKEPSYSKPCCTASRTACLDLRYMAILPLEIREANCTSSAGM